MFRLPGVAGRLHLIPLGNDLPLTYYSALCIDSLGTQSFLQVRLIEPVHCDGSFFNGDFLKTTYSVERRVLLT